jgi:UMF1 family MFS transporter
MAAFIPAGRSAEFFGFFAISGRFSAVLGPVVFGWATYYGGHRAGLLSTLIFFAAGLLMLTGVNVARGKASALRPPEDA